MRYRLVWVHAGSYDLLSLLHGLSLAYPLAIQAAIWVIPESPEIMPKVLESSVIVPFPDHNYS